PEPPVASIAGSLSIWSPTAAPMALEGAGPTPLLRPDLRLQFRYSLVGCIDTVFSTSAGAVVVCSWNSTLSSRPRAELFSRTVTRVRSVSRSSPVAAARLHMPIVKGDDEHVGVIPALVTS